jgi:hypothetical protein
MEEATKKRDRFIPQNMGWLDRLLRFIIGTALLTYFATTLVIFTDPVWLESGREASDWVYYMPFVSVYFFLTAFLGADPIYGLFHIRSCGNSTRNPCGTFPFEVDAAIGNNPVPDSDVEHSLSASHHERSGLKGS